MLYRSKLKTYHFQITYPSQVLAVVAPTIGNDLPPTQGQNDDWLSLIGLAFPKDIPGASVLHKFLDTVDCLTACLDTIDCLTV